MNIIHITNTEIDIATLLTPDPPPPLPMRSGSWMDNPTLLAERRIRSLRRGDGMEVLPGVRVDRHNVYEASYYIGLLNPKLVRGMKAAIRAAVESYDRCKAA